MKGKEEEREEGRKVWQGGEPRMALLKHTVELWQPVEPGSNIYKSFCRFA